MNIYKLLPIDNWEIFEDLCRDLWDNILKDYKVKRFGRRGQKQKGLDITCKLKNKIIGIQCKCVKELTTDDIDDELEKLNELTIELTEYIIATTVSRDTNLDEHVFKISQEQNLPFDMSIIFWEDIEDMLFKESNLSIIKDYYPDYFYDDSQLSQILNQGIEQFKKGEFKSAESCLNTIKDSLDRFSRKNKYELCILEGKFLETCRKFKESGKKFIESYNYSSKDITAKYYKALGLYYDGQTEDSKEICTTIIEKDPNNELAYSLLVLLDKNGVNVPEKLCNSTKINYNKGLNAYLDGDYEKTYEFFKKSKCENPIQLIKCVNVRFHLFYQDETFPMIISQEDYNKIIKIERIFQESIDKLSDNILLQYNDQLLLLLTINKLLKNYESMRENLDRGLKVNEDNKELLFYKAVLLHEKNKDDEAMEILVEIPDILDSFKLINLISMHNDDYNTIIKYGEDLIDKLDKESEHYLYCQDALIESYIETERFDDAEKLIKSEKNPFRYNLLKSKLCLDKTAKKKLLLKSYDNMHNGFIMNKIQLAIEFANLREFEYAISIFESIIDLKRFNPLTNDLAYCYFENEDYEKLISLNEYFIENCEYHPRLIEFEINAYLKINDFKKALRLINIYLKHVEVTYPMRIAKAKIQLFNEDYREVDKFINEKHDFKELTPTQSLEIYSIYRVRTEDKLKLMEMLFEIRSVHGNDKEIHKVYTQEFLDARLNFDNPLKIDYGTGVLLKYENKEELVYVTKNNPDIHKFSQFEKIINHKKGDVITLETNVKIEILEIYDKFTFAFKESLNIVKLTSPEYIRVFNFDSVEDNIKQIQELTLDKHKRQKDLKKQYQNSFKPLCVFSDVSGMDMYDSYFYLKEEGLKSFSNDEPYLYIKRDLVFDSTSLFTIHLLNIEDKIAENYDVHISTSEFFMLKRIQDQVKSNLSSDTVVGYDNNDEFRVSNSNYKQKYKYISKIIDWINENCEITPLKSLFHLNKKEKENLNQIPYSNIRENILIGYADCILVSDDLDIKKLINRFFKVNTCGTLNLIQDLYAKNKIIKSEFEGLILKLYAFNFKDVPLTAEIIITAVKKENYEEFIKFIFDYTVDPRKYLNFNWDYIIKNLNRTNCCENILFEMCVKLFSNIIFMNHCDLSIIKIDNIEDKNYITSKNSNIFHDIECSYAKKISGKNKRLFNNKKEALELGYKPCNKCIK